MRNKSKAIKQLCIMLQTINDAAKTLIGRAKLLRAVDWNCVYFLSFNLCSENKRRFAVKITNVLFQMANYSFLYLITETRETNLQK